MCSTLNCRISGIVDIFEDGTTGLYDNLYDPINLAIKIKAAFSGYGRLTEIKNDNHFSVGMFYTYEKNLDNLLEVLEIYDL